MIPILYNANATVYTTNGIGRLAEATECICTEERNGQYELEMSYPVDGRLFDEIQHSRIIVIEPAQGESLQAFRIYDISKPMDGVITVNAQHISYQLNNIPVAPYSASSLSDALTKIKNNSMETNPFTFTTDKTSTSKCGMTVPTMARACMGGHDGSLLDVYGGEWKFDNYTCSLLNARGSDNGVTIRYGKNLVSLEQEENIANTYTGIVPYWSASDSDECVYASAVHASTAANYPYQRTQIVDFSSDFEAKPTVAQLTTAAQNYITANNIGYPVVSLKVDFVNLADTEEYKDIAPLENIKLCDTVTVVFDKLGISEKAKVVKTEWDVLNERYQSIEIGSIQTSLSTTIAGQGAAIETNLAKAREFTKDATGWLTNGAGYVVANKNSDGSWKELLFLDRPTTAAATKVLRINENGIGFASGTAGTFDSWVYYQAWTLDGNLSLGGVNNSYGTLRILNNAGTQIGKWDKDGISFYSTAYNSYSYIAGATEGFRTISGNDEAMVTPAEISVEDKTSGDYASMTSGGFLASDNNNNETNVSAANVSVTNGTDTTEVEPDGVYVNGQKIGVVSGYTGTLENVTQDLDIDISGDNWSCGEYTLHFENGLLVSVD